MRNENDSLGSDSRFPAILGDDEILAGVSEGVCPECLAIVECQIIFRESKVFMRKYCEQHGLFETLIYSDVRDYVKAARFNRAGIQPLHHQAKISKGCPDDCGLCEAHEQHTCVAVAEITNRCDLECPVCFANTDGKFELPFEIVKNMIDTFVKCEREPEVLQLSGGEPTTHPDIFNIVNYASRRGIKYVVLNTNGLRLAERSFAEQLASSIDSRTSSGLYVYLQFDGFERATDEVLRGRGLIAERTMALDNCRELGLPVTLVPTLVKGANDHEIGALIDLALREENIKMVNFQPLANVGRCRVPGPQTQTMTIPDVLAEVEIQTLGFLRKEDFINVPCPHPTCAACTYVYKNGNSSFVLNRMLNIDQYIDYIVNLALPHTGLTKELKKAADSLLSMSAIAGSGKIEEAICTISGLAIPNIKEIADKVTMISVHAFMDRFNFDLKRAKKCCVTQILPDGNMVPFCVYNVLYRDSVSCSYSSLY